MQRDPDWLTTAKAKGLILTDKQANVASLLMQAACRGAIVPEELLQGDTEKEFQDRLVAYAKELGWKAAHCRPGRVVRDGEEKYETPWLYDGRGMVDLILVRPGDRVIWAEIKSERGVLRPEQELWRNILLAAGQEWYEWRPSDWLKIVEVLR